MQADEITQMLKRARDGDAAAEAELVAHVYPDLRRIAASRLRRETPGHGLQVTELVNEVYVRIFGSATPVDRQNRAHFSAVVAQQVRHILVDYARKRHKGGHVSIELNEAVGQPSGSNDSNQVDVAALDEVLQRLEAIDGRAARGVVLRFFGGLTLEEAAAVLGVNVATVKRDWAFAKSWLFDQLRGNGIEPANPRPQRGGAMNKQQPKLKVGDSVVVKPGTKDPDTGGDISGWQGCITDFSEDDHAPTVGIRWDSLTLKNMPRATLQHSEDEGLDWQCMYLYLNEVAPAPARDTEQDVQAALAEIDKQSHWLYLGEEGKRIQEVLDGIDPDDEPELLDAWEVYLEKKLSFPFEAEISEYQERGPLRTGERVQVKSIYETDDLYGIIVEVRRGREKFWFPLCDLEATDRGSTNYQFVKDYAVWFANR